MDNLKDQSLPLDLPQPTLEGVKTFLCAMIKGVGKVNAERITEQFGSEVINADFDLSANLKAVPGLGENKISDIKESFDKLPASPEILSILFSSGVSEAEAKKIVSHYKKNLEKVLREDPYQMVDEVFKLSFFTADKIGKFLKIETDDPRRLRGALLTAVKIYGDRGSLFATIDEAVTRASKISGVSPDNILPAVESLVVDQRLIKSHNGLYLPYYYEAEKEGAAKIADIIKNFKREENIFPLPAHDLEGHAFSSEQIHGIETVINNPVSVITGGPGTGKTTTIRGIIKLLEDQDKKVVLAAPTGRAAKRLSVLAGREALTLHRLLGYSQGRGYRKRHFDTDVIIIDESSMLEQVMFNHLLQALDSDTRIVLVGDTEQLPAIGAGNVLKDMIDSGTIPVVKLTENFRNCEGSGIALNATSIKEGKVPDYSTQNDFIILTENSEEQIHGRLLRIISEELPLKYDVKAHQIQVVSPQKEGSLGSKQLNLDLQELLNGSSPGVKYGSNFFRLGDRVMQRVNSSQRHIYNGETGWISSVSPDGAWLEVTFFDGKISRYEKRELKELALSYATTVHKLQGSETDFLVMPISLSQKKMLYRNLLYTGVSRARKLCVLLGQEKAIRTAIENPSPSIRNSNFKKRLCEQLPQLKDLKN